MVFTAAVVLAIIVAIDARAPDAGVDAYMHSLEGQVAEHQQQHSHVHSHDITFLDGAGNDIRIMSCTSDGMLLRLRRATALTVGTILWSLPSTSQATTVLMCDSCELVPATITHIGPLLACDDTVTSAACPGDTYEVQVHTEPAPLWALFDRELLKAMGNNVNEQMTVRDALGCSHVHAARDELHNPVTSVLRGDVDIFALLSRDAEMSRVRGSPGFPSDCIGWFAVGPDGQCKYTDCFVGVDASTPNPDCFYCGADCDNGCGPKSLALIIPDEIPGVYNFSDACCKHDMCVKSKFERFACDDAFLKDMLDSCTEHELAAGMAGVEASVDGTVGSGGGVEASVDGTVGSGGRVQRKWSAWTTRGPLDALRLRQELELGEHPFACRVIADTFHLAVYLLGGRFYEENQRRRRAYEQSAACQQ